MAGLRVGIDVGGTFTDIVLLSSDGSITTRKVLSTPDDYSRAIKGGLAQLLVEPGHSAGAVEEVIHGATLATNAIVERKGARTGLLTTRGFRDVLEIRRMRVQRLYDIYWEKPVPLVRRRWRRGVTERTDFNGDVVIPLDEEEAREQVRWLLDEGVESIAVCFLHSYANPAHELRVGELVREEAPEADVSLSCQVLPEIREYERTSTTVINAYIRPLIEGYLQRMESDLAGLGIRAPLFIMQCNGGLMPVAAARERPIHIIESGPAAGVIGALRLSQRMGLNNVITLDIGGTTAKCSLIEGGGLTRSPEYEVGAGISIGHRLLKGGGYLLRVPTVDIAEVGAGGGSVAWVDQGGSLQVGPQSVGASPGPACYGIGGTEATLTDANVFLGYLNPQYLAGGTIPLDYDRARLAVEEGVARPMGMEVTDAAWAIHLIADSNMVRALRAVSTERGRDPRNFALFAFGGKGPVHAVGIARALDIGRIVIPPAPGLFSSFGLLFSDVEHHFVQTYLRPTREMDLDELNRIMSALEEEGSGVLASEGYRGADALIQRLADVRYSGQGSELTLPIEPGALTMGSLAMLEEAFAQEHDRTYGYRSDGEAVELVGLRVIARGVPKEARVPETMRLPVEAEAGEKGRRSAYFGKEHGWLDTLLVGRAALAGTPRDGPLIVDEYDSTTVVPPGYRASLDGGNNIIIEAQ